MTSPPDSLLRTLLFGALVFVVGIVPAMLLKPVAPLLSNYLGLFLPVLSGFAFSFLSRSAAVVVAGFFGIAGGIGALGFYDRALEVAAGQFVALRSAADAPGASGATRFSFADAHAEAALAGHSTSTSTGKRTSTWTHHAAPLVGRGWTPKEPVSAWLACTTTPGFSCVDTSPRVAGAVRAEAVNAEAYVRAVHDSEARHHLESVPGAPVLIVAEDPERRPQLLYAEGLMIAVGSWGVWALAVVIARVAGALRRRG